MAIADFTDIVHTGPGTLAGRYLRMFWQPVYRAQDLPPGRAIPIRTMGEDFTLYRGESGAAHVVDYRCAHRGTQLSVGWVEGDCIRCRYHGWMYDDSGQCVEQPGEETDPCRVHIRSYPTQEYLGLIFAYFSEGDPPPIRRYPDLEQPGVFEVDPPEIWPCNYFNRQDNDPYHTVWTHRESARRMGRPQNNGLDGIQFVETDYGMGCPTPGGSNSHFHMPNTHQLKVRVRVPGYEKRWEYRLCWHLPIDDEHCIAYDVNLVTGLSGEDAERFRQKRRAIQEENDVTSPYEIAEAILAGKMRVEDVDPELSYYKQFWIEDYVTQVGQGTIADRTQERLGRTDVRTILKRQLWQRELKALAEGRPLKQWTSPMMYDGA